MLKVPVTSIAKTNESNMEHIMRDQDTSKSTLSSLPNELILAILGHVHDTQDLLSCSLVSRKIGNLTQLELFKEIVIPHARDHGKLGYGNIEDVRSLFNTLKRKPQLAVSTTTLRIGEVSINQIGEKQSEALARIAAVAAVRAYVQPPKYRKRAWPHRHQVNAGGPLHQAAPGIGLSSRAAMHALPLRQERGSSFWQHDFSSTLFSLLILQLPVLRVLEINDSDFLTSIFSGAATNLLASLESRLPRLRKLAIMCEFSHRRTPLLTSVSDNLQDIPVIMLILPRYIPSIDGIRIIRTERPGRHTTLLTFDSRRSLLQAKNLLPYKMPDLSTYHYPNIKTLHLNGNTMDQASLTELTHRFSAVHELSYDITPLYNGPFRHSTISAIGHTLRAWNEQLSSLRVRVCRDHMTDDETRQAVQEVKLEFMSTGKFPNAQEVEITIDTVSMDRNYIGTDNDIFPPLPTFIEGNNEEEPED